MRSKIAIDVIEIYCEIRILSISMNHLPPLTRALCIRNVAQELGVHRRLVVQQHARGGGQLRVAQPTPPLPLKTTKRKEKTKPGCL